MQYVWLSILWFFYALIFLFIAYLMAQVTVIINDMVLHRSRTHEAVWFANWLLNIFQVYLAIDAGNGSSRNWIGLHLIHHDHVDTDLDPHTPHVLEVDKNGKTTKGHNFWFVMFGLLILHFRACRDRQEEIIAATPNFEPTLVERWVDKLRIPKLGLCINSYGFLGMLLCGAIGWLSGFGFWLGALLWFCHAVIAMIMVGMINSMGHSSPVRDKKIGHASNRHKIWAWFLAGQGAYHRIHHKEPKAYYLGRGDIPGYIIKQCLKLGWAKIPSRVVAR